MADLTVRVDLPIFPGMMTAEGQARIDKAVDAFQSQTAETANVTSQFIEGYRWLLQRGMSGLTTEEREDIEGELRDCEESIRRRRDTQEEMLLAIGGRPNPRAEKVAVK